MPATRKDISKSLLKSNDMGLTSIVVCCEDSIGESDIQFGEKNIFSGFKEFSLLIEHGDVELENVPLIFLRVRNVEQFQRMIEKSLDLSFLCGFVFPKFSIKTDGERYINLLRQINETSKRKFYGMPILESPEVIYKESRIDELLAIKNFLDRYKDIILNIRIGATDFSGIYAIRRKFDQTIYDISVIRDCIGDIVNIFLRPESDYVISGPVWKYFPSGKRLLKPLLRESAFISEMGERGMERRKYLIDQYIDGLIRETLLDKANGLTGKTVIHPTHISIVNALQVVKREEYEDAKLIIEGHKQGAYKSPYCNKMNESVPHFRWAKKILNKAEIYGVLNEGRNYTSLFI